jgi:ATP-dependent 26S proteasome regulatory subunit
MRKNMQKEQLSKFEKAENEIKLLIRARRPIIYIICDEKETDITEIIHKMCKEGTSGSETKKQLFVWDSITGLKLQVDTIDESFVQEPVSEFTKKDPASTLDGIAKHFPVASGKSKDPDVVYIFNEFHHYLWDPSIQRRLRIFTEQIVRDSKKLLILLSPRNDGRNGKLIPKELENIIHLFEWPYPDPIHIRKIMTKQLIPQLNTRIKSAKNKIKQIEFNEQELTDVVNSCKGLTVRQIQAASMKSMIVKSTLDPHTISEEKKQIIKKNGTAEYVEPSQTLTDIGGLDNLKNWLKERKVLLTDEATSFGCDKPNGVLLLGPWGTGKTTAAKAIINEWGLPAMRVDVSKLFDMYVGQSERLTSNLLELADSISPCILWFDEIENIVGGSGSSTNDGGTSSRVLGLISTWMSEHEGFVFCIFTGNDISNSPPKLFRKGRLDEIFILDLPTIEERKEIFKIHISKKLKIQDSNYGTKNFSKIDSFDLELLSAKTPNFSGAEIESIVQTANIRAFNDKKRMMTTQDLILSISETIPISVTMRDQIEKIREWQNGRAVKASIYPTEVLLEPAKIKQEIGYKKEDVDIEI